MIILPLPPSVNALYFNVGGKGRVKSAAYDSWIGSAGLMLNIARVKPLLEAKKICFDIMVPEKMRGDIDNRVKAILDLYVRHRIIRDDSNVWKLSISRDAETPDKFAKVCAYNLDVTPWQIP